MPAQKIGNLNWNLDFAAVACSTRADVDHSVCRLQRLDAQLLSGERPTVRIDGSWYAAHDVGRYLDPVSRTEKIGVCVCNSGDRNWFAFDRVEFVI